MAKKVLFRNLPAYQEGPFALLKSPDDGLWRIYHIQSNSLAMWIIAPFKQKGDALELAKQMNLADIEWNVNTNIQLFERNQMDHIHTVMTRIKRGLNL